MPKRGRDNDDHNDNHNRKRQKTGTGPRGSMSYHRASTQSTHSQIPGLTQHQRHTQSRQSTQSRNKNKNKNEFYLILKQSCHVRFRSNIERPLELDSPQSIEVYLQRKLQRDDYLRKQFIRGIEEFIDLTETKRFNQLLLPTKPKTNKSQNRFLSEKWKEMSQINEDEIQSISVRKQPSMFRILLNVDCIQNEVINILFDKLDELITDATQISLVRGILEQFKFLDHLVFDPKHLDKLLNC